MPGWLDEGRRIVQGPHLRDLLERAAKSRPFPCVLNAGSGECGYSPLLLNLRGVESVVETDFGFREHSPRRIDARQIFFCSSLVSIPLPDKKFDLILCSEVLEHIQEHERALDEVRRVIAPGGWLLISVPTPPAPPDPAHVREGYHPAYLSAMLTQRGFEIVEMRFCMYRFFRFLFGNWAGLPWKPRILIRGLSVLDQLIPMGPPMDLMILARLPQAGVAAPSMMPPQKVASMVTEA
jgi:SAM-dependent methyltransferase